MALRVPDGQGNMVEVLPDHDPDELDELLAEELAEARASDELRDSMDGCCAIHDYPLDDGYCMACLVGRITNLEAENAALRADTGPWSDLRARAAAEALEVEELKTLATLVMAIRALLPDVEVPPSEVWLVEPLTPLQQAAGFKPRAIGKIINIGVAEEH